MVLSIRQTELQNYSRKGERSTSHSMEQDLFELMLFPKFCKLWESKAPEVYQEADQILEAGDWLTQCMTGGRRRSADLAGYKAMWNPVTGYPPKDLLKEFNPMLANLVEEKLSEDIAMQEKR